MPSGHLGPELVSSVNLAVYTCRALKPACRTMRLGRAPVCALRKLAACASRVAAQRGTCAATFARPSRPPWLRASRAAPGYWPLASYVLLRITVWRQFRAMPAGLRAPKKMLHDHVSARSTALTSVRRLSKPGTRHARTLALAAWLCHECI